MNDRDITFLEKIQLFKKLKSYLTRKLANNEKSNEVNNLKPSRTQRAINAKNERLSNKVHPPEGNKNNENDDFTSDGIEALKPFESSLNKENSRSS